jgi:hypothetical protein
LDLKKHPLVHTQLSAAKDQILKTLQKALVDAGLEHFNVASIQLQVKTPAMKCPEGEEPVFEPIGTDDNDTVIYGWVCKPRS